jgi:hypothetical protein
MVWQEIPDIFSLIGGAIIMGAAILNYKLSKKVID